jgi:hypothetical protein
MKDVRAHLRHSRVDTTANERMQELPGDCWGMVESMYEQLMDGHTAAADLLPNATNNKDVRMGGRSTPTIRKELLGPVSALPTRTKPPARRTLPPGEPGEFGSRGFRDVAPTQRRTSLSASYPRPLTQLPASLGFISGATPTIPPAFPTTHHCSPEAPFRSTLPFKSHTAPRWP